MTDTKIKRRNMVLSIEDIRAILPHRYPFLMIDRITKQTPGRCVAIKNITINECFFQGHFPNQAVMPGMLITEAMAQASPFIGPPQSTTDGTIDKTVTEISDLSTLPVMTKGFLVSMNSKFKEPVIPGDTLVIDVMLVKQLGTLMNFRGVASVDKSIVAEATFSIALLE